MSDQQQQTLTQRQQDILTASQALAKLSRDARLLKDIVDVLDKSIYNGFDFSKAPELGKTSDDINTLLRQQINTLIQSITDDITTLQALRTKILGL